MSPRPGTHAPAATPGSALRSSQTWEKIGLVLISGLAYAVAIAGVDVASNEIAPIALTLLRLATASLVFGVILLFVRPGFRWELRAVLDIFVIGIANIGLPFLLLSLSMPYISSSLASVLFNIQPPLTLLLAHVLLADEKLRPATVLGTLIALSGVLVLLGSNASGLSLTDGQGWIGQLMIILASCSGAFGVVYTRIRARGQNPTVLAAGQAFACLIVFAMLALLTDQAPAPADYSWQAWLAMVVSALSAAVFGYWLLFYMVKKYSASLGGFASIATPLFSAAIGILFLGEVITLPIAAGTILLLAGIWSINRV